jgi:hypothetical protein
MIYGDGPSLAEVALWDELTDAYAENHQFAAERDQACAELTAARAEIDRLNAALAARHRPATRRPVRVG